MVKGEVANSLLVKFTLRVSCGLIDKGFKAKYAVTGDFSTSLRSAQNDVRETV